MAFPINPTNGQTYTNGTGATYIYDSANNSWTVSGLGGGGPVVTVVNDLVTGGTTDALSAQQGVVLKSMIDNLVITGQFIGSAATVAAFPTVDASGDAVSNGDWAVLTADDGANLSGIYTYNGATWDFVMEIPDTFAVAATAISPAADDATGAVGTSTDLAREDHKHPAQGVSADANNSLSIGTDGLHFYQNVDDGNNTNINRADAVEDVAPTAGEAADPVTGDTAIVKLTNNIVEFWSYNGAWNKIFSLPPATLDGNRTNVVRANATTGVAPTAGEVPGPINGDTAAVFLTDGKIEYWAHNGTAWALVNTYDPDLFDGAEHHILRANNTTGVAPTVGEVAVPTNGDTAKVALTDRTIEMYSHNGTTWLLDGTYHPGANRLFADDTTVAPATAGKPTEAEIAVFTAAQTPAFIDGLVYYTGTDTAGDAVVSTYWVDRAGAVTALGFTEDTSYTHVHNGTTDWTASVITVTAATHGMGVNPTVETYEDDGTSWVHIEPHFVKINKTTGDVSIEVTAGAEYAGKVVINKH